MSKTRVIEFPEEWGEVADDYHEFYNIKFVLNKVGIKCGFKELSEKFDGKYYAKFKLDP